MKKLSKLLLRTRAVANLCRGTNTRSFSARIRMVPLVDSHFSETNDLARNSTVTYQRRFLLSDAKKDESEARETHVFKIQKLPFKDQATVIKSILSEVGINPLAAYPLYLSNNLDLLSGDAFIEVDSKEEALKALQLQGRSVDGRPLRVFPAHHENWKDILERQTWVDPYIRLSRKNRDPITDDEIKTIFKDFNFGSNGILRYKDINEISSKRAFVHFADMEEAHKASKHAQEKGIGAFKINWADLKYRLKRTAYGLHMAGIPFTCDTADVVEFFSPTEPVSIFFDFENRKPILCSVYFESKEDMEKALKKDLSYIGQRYIRLRKKTL